MKNFIKILFLLWICAAFPVYSAEPSPRLPNIIVILVDDLGFGDLGCYGATKVRTPNLDQLAAGGIRFTDGHCTSSTCTPSRYSLLTGEYAFRKNSARILTGDAPLIIDPKSPTLPGLLKSGGYATGFVGKWHLGLGQGKLDWNAAISPGPNQIGFDYSFFMPATPDRVPCVYVENHQVVNLSADDPLRVNYVHKIGHEPTGREHHELLRYPADPQHSDTIVSGVSRIGFMEGGHSAWWKDEEMAQRFEEKAAAFVTQNQGKPFFLYYAPHNIHCPRLPNEKFIHTSGCGLRGDSIHELDATMGQFLATLKELKLDDNTLIIFSSDNGPVVNDGYADGSFKELHGHKPAGPYRGGKYSIYEGGTRVPFITSWPGRIKPGVSDALVNQIDLFASLAQLVGKPAVAKERPDSEDILPALLNASAPGRQLMVEQDDGPGLALRDGKWKMVLAGKGFVKKAAEPGDQSPPGAPATPVRLFDLEKDPGESHDVARENPGQVQKMLAELKRMTGK